MRTDVFPMYPNYKNLTSKMEVPLCVPFPHQLKPGLLMSISGQVRDGANRFDINLFTEKRNIALHFNPRFTEHCIVRNSKIDNVWGSEERNGYFPFRQNSLFEILILVTKLAFRISVNRKHHSDFLHRIAFEDVKEIKIDGDVIIDKLQCKTEPLRMNNNDIIDLALKPSTLYNPQLPLDYDINGKVSPNFMVYVSGRPFSAPFRFVFEFKKDAQDESKVFFHFDVRFDEHAVVRNHYDKSWGKEERDMKCFPFTRGVGFDMIFYVQENEFMVAVNGQHFISFNHRLLPLSDIQYFRINGHVVITSVRFCY